MKKWLTYVIICFILLAGMLYGVFFYIHQNARNIYNWQYSSLKLAGENQYTLQHKETQFTDQQIKTINTQWHNLSFQLPRTDTCRTIIRKDTALQIRFCDSTFVVFSLFPKMDYWSVIETGYFDEKHKLVKKNLVKQGINSNSLELLKYIFNKKYSDRQFIDKPSNIKRFYAFMSLKSLFLPVGSEEGLYEFETSCGITGIQYGIPKHGKLSMIDCFVEDTLQINITGNAFDENEMNLVLESIKYNH